MFPPRARGSTGGTAPTHARIVVSPARAGIDLAQKRALVGATLFPPRARGSTCHFFAGIGGWSVSPARAGIDRRATAMSPDNMCFPRARGDRPFAWTNPLQVPQFPPRARGSTLAPNSTLSVIRVSPARAGIDPPPSLPRWRSRSFPRARGDRPPVAPDHAAGSPFPPRARGSTSGRDRGQHRPPVSPARAGIDPCGSSRVACHCRFPRARGDRPIDGEIGRVHKEFPPRARGSTPHGPILQVGRAVSPARAGIDRRPGPTAACRGSFPRARGDRPHSRAFSAQVPWFPPRARGSTAAIISPRRRMVVSPARAGIDPGRHGEEVPRRRFPRARGDRPSDGPRRRPAGRFPPRARGSTAGSREPALPDRVSPARAGIDRAYGERPEVRLRFPRARGDRPFRPGAYAIHRRFPRARGDRPCPGNVPMPLREFPPRARGSTSGVPGFKSP